MDMDRIACYRAISTRDARFDGRLFVGVKTTGIYCRPICPARTPKFQNTSFFASAPAAQEAGFRPCLRCRPVFVRAETPKPLIDRLNEGVVAGLKDDNTAKRLRELGAIVRPSTPEQFTQALKADEANVAELLQKNLLKPE